MNFDNIKPEDLVGKGVVGLPDTPGLNTQQMQEKFDELVRSVMVPKFNALIEELKKISSIESVSQTVEDSETSIPTGKAVKASIDAIDQKATTLFGRTDELFEETNTLSQQTSELLTKTNALSGETEELFGKEEDLSEKTDELFTRTNNLSEQTTLLSQQT